MPEITHKDIQNMKEIMDKQKVSQENRLFMWVDEQGIEHIVSTDEDGQVIQHDKRYVGR